MCHVTDYKLFDGPSIKGAGTNGLEGKPSVGTSIFSIAWPEAVRMKAATIRDVAARARVSVASVSRVLNDASLVAEPTRSRVMDAVRDLQYVPHSGARSLSTSKTDTVGVILPDLFGDFFSELIRGMDLAARAHGLHLIVSSSHDDAEEASAAIRSMRGRVDGLIVLSPHLDAANLAASLIGQMPVLLMNSGADNGGLPSIVVDNHSGAMTAMDHLLSLGRRRIAHIAGPTGNVEAENRLNGYLEALARAGLQPLIVQGDFTRECGHATTLELLDAEDRPDAIFAANDVMAVGALLAIEERGLTCPHDVAVVGFDDIPIAELVRPSLTTLRINIAETGRRALERLVGLIRTPDGTQGSADSQCEIVRPYLVVRSSSTLNPTLSETQTSSTATKVATRLSL